jgi:uncharacterized membrane protein
MERDAQKSQMITSHLKSRLWLLNAIIATALWGVWGACMEIPERAGFPATLGYCIWALTLVPFTIIAAKISGWGLDYDWKSILLGTLSGLLGAGGQMILFQTLRSGLGIIVVPLTSLAPVLTIILSLLIYWVIPHPVLIAGMVLASVAIFLLAGGKNDHEWPVTTDRQQVGTTQALSPEGTGNAERQRTL